VKADGMTLYASSRDAALTVSWLANLFSERAGLLSSSTPVIADHVDSVDVSAAGPELFATNHDLYAHNAVIADDLRRLLQQRLHPPDKRNPVFRRCGVAGASYWQYVAPGDTTSGCK
jgi:esterase/lipase superfamily enzyme